MLFWANVFLGKCPSGQMSSGQMSLWANVLLGKRPSGQMSSGQMSFWANVFLGKRLLGKRLMGKCPSGQMSFWANVFWANVFSANVSGQMFLGKCRMGKCRMGKCRVTVIHTVRSSSSPILCCAFDELLCDLEQTACNDSAFAYDPVELVAGPHLKICRDLLQECLDVSKRWLDINYVKAKLLLLSLHKRESMQYLLNSNCKVRKLSTLLWPNI
jgi:hypothetical protein